MLNFTSMANNQRQQFIRNQYNKIYAHEAAHKAAGGSLAGGIVIEKNSEGVPVGGHVDIKMPTLDVNNPDKTIGEANTVIASAMAPSDPSAQDFRVAAAATQVLGQAESLKHKQGLNYLA